MLRVLEVKIFQYCFLEERNGSKITAIDGQCLSQPHFDYCNVVWGNCNNGLSDKLQRLQNRAARILMSTSYDSNLDDLFQALGWRRLYPDNISAYRLRNTEYKIVLPQPRTDYLKRSFFCTAELTCGTTSP